MKSEKISQANRMICPHLNSSPMTITKANSSDSGREGAILQNIINAVVAPEISGTASTPIQVSQETLIKEEPEEAFLRHFYESATWRMFYRITASRRKESGSKLSDKFFLESRTPPLDHDDDLIRPQRLLRGSTSRLPFKFHHIEGMLDDKLDEGRLLYHDDQEGIFDLEMEI